jgi:hypothetical protein
MVEMSDETKELVRQSVTLSKTVFQYAFIPVVIYLGMGTVLELFWSLPSIIWVL